MTAPTIVNKTSVGSPTDATSRSTPSITPGANKLLIAAIEYSVTSGTAVAPSGVTGNGLTWESLIDVISGTNGISIWVAKTGASPSAGAVTVSWAATTIGQTIIVDEVTDCDLTGANAVDAFTANTGTFASTASSPKSVSLGSAPTAANRCYAAFSAASSGPNYTVGANWAELTQDDHATPNRALQTQWRSDAADQTATSAGWASTISLRAAVLEIKAGPTALGATAAGVSTFAATMRVTHPMGGTAAGVASFAGTMRVTHKVAGTAAGVSTFAGTMRVTHSLVGTAAGVGSFAGSMRVTHRLAGTFAATSGFTASLTNTKRLLGTIAGQSSMAATLRVLHALVGTSAGVGGFTGSMRVAHTLVGSTFAGVSTFAASLSVTRVHFLGAQANGVSGFTATMRVARPLAAVFAGVSSMTAARLSNIQALHATFAGVSSFTVLEHRPVSSSTRARQPRTVTQGRLPRNQTHGVGNVDATSAPEPENITP